MPAAYRVIGPVRRARAASEARVPTSNEMLAIRGHGFGSERHAENIVVRMPNRSQGASVTRNPTAKSAAAATWVATTTRRGSRETAGGVTPTSRVAHSTHSTRPRTGTAHERHAVRPHEAHRSTACRSG